MALMDIVGKLLPLAGMIKPAIAFISDVVNQLSPDNLTPEDAAELQKYIGSVYAIAKNFGPDLVLKSTNDLDDAALVEVIEICEQAAVKYSLNLNPLELA